jgi:hypothetical protein
MADEISALVASQLKTAKQPRFERGLVTSTEAALPFSAVVGSQPYMAFGHHHE